MKMILLYICAITLSFLPGCNTTTVETKGAYIAADKLYFDFTIDGKEIKLNPEEDILTSYNEFKDHREFKVFAGKENEPNLILTIISDMSKPSSTPNGSPSSDFLSTGSVSLQGYPEKGYTFNNYDMYLTPDPPIVPDAIVVTKSELTGTDGRIITGTINTTTFIGEDSKTDPNAKPYVIKGKFRIKHTFNGIKF